MKLYIFLIMPLLAAMLIGCENKPEPPVVPPPVDDTTTIVEPVKMVREVYINHEATLCGIADPAENHTVVKEKIDYYLTMIEQDSLELVDVTIGIFEDSVGNQTWLRYNAHAPIMEDVYNGYYRGVSVFDCDSALFGGAWFGDNPFLPDFQSYTAPYFNGNTAYSPPVPCDDCEEYFKHNKLVDTIAHILNMPEEYFDNEFINN